MTKNEQHSMVESLREYSHKMKGKDYDEFEVLRKRDRDDEDFDSISRNKLTELFVKYVPDRFRR